MKSHLGNKVVLIGAGEVGLAFAFALVNQSTVDQLAIIDMDEKRAWGNVQDLNHAVPWAPSRTVVTQGTYDDCADADLIVLCAGAAQKPGETRLQLVNKNVAITKSIVEDAMSHGFDGIFLVASNPVDILANAAYKFSGLPSERVIGSGTILDSARYCYMLGEEFDIAPSSVNACIIGEHGDSELPAISAASVAGVSIGVELEKDPSLEDRLYKIFEKTRDAAYDIINAKGFTNYGVGMGLARITRAIFHNEHVALPVSTLLNGEYGEKDIYIGTPAVIGRGGVERVVELALNEKESEAFKASAKTLRDIRDSALK